MASKRGQTVVEYILLLAFVAALVVGFSKTAEEPLAQLLEDQTLALRTEASRGGQNTLEEYHAQGAVSKAVER